MKTEIHSFASRHVTFGLRAPEQEGKGEGSDVALQGLTAVPPGSTTGRCYLGPVAPGVLPPPPRSLPDGTGRSTVNLS